MRSYLALIFLFTGLSASAEGVKYFCKERAEFKRRTVVLTQLNGATAKEGFKTPYRFEVYTDSTKPEISVLGLVETQDAMFVFTSNDKTYSFEIFMDELDQASLSVKGQDKTTPYECN